MPKRYGLMIGALVLVIGCGDKSPPPAPPAQRIAGAAGAVDLEPYVLPAKPADVPSLAALRGGALPAGEVVFRGQVPPASTKPFLTSRAAFLLLAPEDLADPAIKEELECGEAAT
jgi:hypothetical protein